MSSTNGNGKSNLLISYLLKGKTTCEQIDEEQKLKNELAQFMTDRGYKYIIADDEFITEKLLT